MGKIYRIVFFLVLFSSAIQHSYAAPGSPGAVGGGGDGYIVKEEEESRKSQEESSRIGIALGWITGMFTTPEIPLKTKVSKNNTETPPRRESASRKYFMPAPLVSMRKIMDSKVEKDFHKSMVMTQLAMFHITAAVTEPGASAGLARALQLGQEELGNRYGLEEVMMEQLDRMDPTGQTGQNRIAYMAKLIGNEKNSFPEAQSVAYADKDKNPKSQNFDKIKADATGFDFSGRPELEAATGAGAGGSPGAVGGGGGSEKKESSLLELAFGKDSGNGADKIKKDFEEYVGDVKYKIKPGEGDGSVSYELKYDEPKTKPEKHQKDTTKAVWKSLLTTMYDLCMAKRDAKVSSSDEVYNFSSKTFWEDKMKDKYKDISTVGFMVTPNLGDQLFNMFLRERVVTDPKIKCEDLQTEADKDPYEPDAAAAGGGSQDKPIWKTVYFRFAENIAMGRILTIYERFAYFVSEYADGDSELNKQLQRQLYQMSQTGNLREARMKVLQRLLDLTTSLGEYSKNNTGGAGQFFKANGQPISGSSAQSDSALSQDTSN